MQTSRVNLGPKNWEINFFKHETKKHAAGANDGNRKSPRYAPTRNPKTQKRAKRIKTVSPKKAKQDREYTKLRKQFLVDHPKCEIEWDDKCAKKANQVHHVKRRGKNYLNVSTWKASCRHCHEMVEHNGSEAEARGFLVREYSENKS